MSRAEQALIAWAKAEQAADTTLNAWRAEIDEDLPASKAAKAKNLPSYRAFRAAVEAEDAAMAAARDLAHELLEADPTTDQARAAIAEQEHGRRTK